MREGKLRVLAIILYIFFAPLSIGELYLGYRKKFKNQIIRYILLVVGVIILNSFSNINLIKYITIILLVVLAFNIFFIQIINYIKGFKIIIKKISVDAYGNKLI